MPRYSAWAVRLSLLYLLSGFTFGALLLANKGIPFDPLVWRLLPAHVDFLLFGWTVHLVFGVAYWILPRLPGGSRGSLWLPWLSLGLLNLGILLVVVYSLLNLAFLLAAARACQAAAVGAYALAAWPRIRSAIPNPS